MDIQVWLFADISSKTNEMRPLLQETEMTTGAVNNNIWEFKWKLDFRKFYIHQREFYNFPKLKAFSDEMGDDIKKPWNSVFHVAMQTLQSHPCKNPLNMPNVHYMV